MCVWGGERDIAGGGFQVPWGPEPPPQCRTVRFSLPSPGPHLHRPVLTQPCRVGAVPPHVTQPESPSGARGRKLMLILGIVKGLMSIFS